MDKITDFPERMHKAFAELVATEIIRSAAGKGLDIDRYLYCLQDEEDDPACFGSTASLRALYTRYRPLIDMTCRQLPSAEGMSCEERTYLCYRLYLVSMSRQRNSPSVTEAREELQRALRAYWQSRNRFLPLAHEVMVLELLDELIAELNPKPAGGNQT